jgi:hypothetical protein
MQRVLFLLGILLGLFGRRRCRDVTVAFGTTLAIIVTLATACAASAHDTDVFRVPPPTGDPAADLAAVKATVAAAKAWQAGQPNGADGLAAKVEVVLAPGTYELCPTGTSTPAPPQGGGGQSCLQFTNWENLVFRGTGDETRIVLLDPDEGYINFFQSRHVRVADVTLDMKTVPFTQGRIAAVHLNGVNLASLDVQLDAGFQTFADPIYQFHDGNFLVIMDPVAARPKPGVPNFMRIAFTPPPYSGGIFAWGVLLPNGKTWRLTFDPTVSPAWRFTDPLHPPIVPGDRFVFVTRRPNHGIFATLSDTVTITHVTIHAAGALTTGFVNSTGPLLIDDLDVRIPRGSPRLISTDADGAHFQNDRGPVTIRNSSFQGMADDAIAIYSLATTIKQVTAPGANGKVVDFSPRVILVGDRLQILDATDGAIRGTGTAPWPRTSLTSTTRREPASPSTTTSFMRTAAIGFCCSLQTAASPTTNSRRCPTKESRLVHITRPSARDQSPITSRCGAIHSTAATSAASMFW